MLMLLFPPEELEELEEELEPPLLLLLLLLLLFPPEELEELEEELEPPLLLLLLLFVLVLVFLVSEPLLDMEPEPPLHVSLQSPLLQEELMELQLSPSHLTSPLQETVHFPLLQEEDGPDSSRCIDYSSTNEVQGVSKKGD